MPSGAKAGSELKVETSVGAFTFTAPSGVSAGGNITVTIPGYAGVEVVSADVEVVPPSPPPSQPLADAAEVQPLQLTKTDIVESVVTACGSAQLLPSDLKRRRGLIARPRDDASVDFAAVCSLLLFLQVTPRNSVVAGTILHVKTNRGLFQITVPADVAPGDSITVTIPGYSDAVVVP